MFAFLESQGFRLVTDRVTLLRYERPDIRTRIIHARQGFNVGVEVGLRSLKGGREYPCSIGEIMAAHKLATEPAHLGPAQDREAVREQLKVLAGLLRQYGQSALRGDRRLYKAVEQVQWEYTKQFTKGGINKLSRDADRAYEAGDYLKATNIWIRFEGRLNDEELAKLRDAQRRA